MREKTSIVVLAVSLAAVGCMHDKFAPSANTTLGGPIVARSVNIPKGVTVTVDRDLYIESDGEIEIDGSLVAAAAKPGTSGPSITLVSAKDIVISGEISSGHGGDAAELVAKAPALTAAGSGAPAKAFGHSGGSGGGLTLEARGAVRLLPGARIASGNGGRGGTARAFGADGSGDGGNGGAARATGGTGGVGGSIRIRCASLEIPDEKVFRVGNGGNGGMAEATGGSGASASKPGVGGSGGAIGGNGGQSGVMEIPNPARRTLDDVMAQNTEGGTGGGGGTGNAAPGGPGAPPAPTGTTGGTPTAVCPSGADAPQTAAPCNGGAGAAGWLFGGPGGDGGNCIGATGGTAPPCCRPAGRGGTGGRGQPAECTGGPGALGRITDGKGGTGGGCKGGTGGTGADGAPPGVGGIGGTVSCNGGNGDPAGAGGSCTAGPVGGNGAPCTD